MCVSTFKAENVAWQKLQINDKEKRYDKRQNRIVNMTLEIRSF